MYPDLIEDVGKGQDWPLVGVCACIEPSFASKNVHEFRQVTGGLPAPSIHTPLPAPRTSHPASPTPYRGSQNATAQVGVIRLCERNLQFTTDRPMAAWL